MKHITTIAAVIIFFFIAGCKKYDNDGLWRVRIEDGAEVYNYSGITRNSAISSRGTASFESSANINGTNDYNTRSKFIVELGNISSIGMDLIFNCSDSSIVANLKKTNSNTVRFNALKQVIKPGIYAFKNAPIETFFFYKDKSGQLWATDERQNNFLEVVSVGPNAQDNTANALIAQINFDIGLRDINFTATKRIKGSIFSFYNLD
jgi:hypothetical protein